MDLDLAWEFAPEGEFGFAELASDYFQAQPTLAQQAVEGAPADVIVSHLAPDRAGDQPPSRSRFAFIGEDAKGAHLRVLWFPGSTAPLPD